MKELPILFNTPMVRAILEDRKSQTRRIVDITKYPQYPDNLESLYAIFKQFPNQSGHPFKDADQLWVKETFSPCIGPMGESFVYAYRATDKDEFGPWKPSIFMTREASRINLLKLDTWAERVADISEEDAIAEGIDQCEGNFSNRWKDYQARFIQCGFASPIDSYRSLWNSIYNKPQPKRIKKEVVSYTVYPFDEDSSEEWEGQTTYRNKPLIVIPNPLVWVTKFKRITEEI